MEKPPQISEAEYEIMKVIWEDSPVSTNDVCKKVSKSHNWSSKTVHTLLSRLTAKHAVSYEQRGRMYYYSPLISQKEYLSLESRHFLDRFYDGSVTALLSFLLSDLQCSDSDLKELQMLLGEKSNL